MNSCFSPSQKNSSGSCNNHCSSDSVTGGLFDFYMLYGFLIFLLWDFGFSYFRALDFLIVGLWIFLLWDFGFSYCETLDFQTFDFCDC